MSLKQGYFSYCLGKISLYFVKYKVINKQMAKQSTQKAGSAGNWSLCQIHVMRALKCPIPNGSLCPFSAQEGPRSLNEWLLCVSLLTACGPALPYGSVPSTVSSYCSDDRLIRSLPWCSQLHLDAQALSHSPSPRYEEVADLLLMVGALRPSEAG